MATGNKVGHPLASEGLLTDSDTAQKNMLGQRAYDDNGNEYIYLQYAASSGILAGDWVLYNNANAQASFTALRIPTTASVGVLAVAIAAALSGAGFGWFQIYGLTPTFTAIGTDASGDGKVLSIGGAAGRMQTGAVATKLVFGSAVIGNPASNTGTAFICYPSTVGTDPV